MLRLQTGEVLRHHHTASRSEPTSSVPELGALFLLPATADFFIEWAVIARHRRAVAYLLIVPADTHPLIGSADVEVSADRAIGPLCLRCSFGVWLTADWLDPRLFSGRLERHTVRHARYRQRALELGATSDTSGVHEVDADPAYRDWSRELRRATQRLVRTLATGT